jgi:hypothetical protein
MPQRKWQCRECGRMNWPTMVKCTCGVLYDVESALDGRPSTMVHGHDLLLNRLKQEHGQGAPTIQNKIGLR